ncbi:DNA polymerase III subunit beta [Paralimibaculum aggregatum]|uniref:Beta sliding clamp n=1 Tax=Paralimibaculum aggregatum TaxID=3036245 RepID=A0ABQ6LFU7_9RHOB|nr:DNA polymerase III subunit beta [Limibaculum sp. NKW23]GMG82204.1 DNA polymerase III subunit beta [Limibaculum sp. NKW23]
MKLRIDRAALLKAMSRAQGVVERKNTIPILANVLLDARDDSLSLRATDLDIEIVEKIAGEIDRPGATTVAAHLLHEIVRKLPDGAELTLTAEPDTGRLEVSAGRSRFQLATLPKEDFPMMASAEFACDYTAAAPLLRRLFDKSKFAVSTEETRYYLNGVFLHVAEDRDGKHLRAVATDGHRLARIDGELPEGADGAPGVIVPRKTVGELRKMLDDDDAAVAVSVSETKIRFAVDGLVLTSKVIDGAFPDYARVIPAENDKRMEVEAQAFYKAVDRVATVSQERSRTVKLALDEDRLVLSVNAPDAGSASEEVEVAYPFEPMEIGFNARYLLEIAGQIERENAVFAFSDPGSPTVVSEGDDRSAIYVVMPMRV